MKKLIFILYPIFLVLFLFFSYAFVDSNLTYLKNLYTGFSYDKKFLTTVLFASFTLIYFIFYMFFLILLKKNRLSLKDVKILIAITIGILFLAYPAMLSYDIFNYLATSKVLFFYRENPYIIMPIEFIGEPLLSFTRASNKVALYGSFWLLLSGIPHFLGFGNFLMTLFSFKLFVVLFYIGTTFLIYKISKNIFSVLFFALNPLIVIEVIISSHNDIIMMFFALLSFWVLIKKRLLLSLLFLFLSILIKYATIFLLPVIAYMIWQQYLYKREINLERTSYFSIVLMMLIFFLSPLREEIYPWYAIWFLTFIALIPKKKIIISGAIIFSFSLLLRYLPYMYSGTYGGLMPVIKTMVSFIPSGLFGAYYVIKKKV